MAEEIIQFPYRGRDGNPIGRRCSGKIILPSFNSPVKPELTGEYYCEVVKETPRAQIVRVLRPVKDQRQHFFDGFEDGADDCRTSHGSLAELPDYHRVKKGREDLNRPFDAGWHAGYAWYPQATECEQDMVPSRVLTRGLMAAREKAYDAWSKR